MATKKPRSIQHQKIDGFDKLGRRIEIGATTRVTVNKPGMKIHFPVESVEIMFGVGRDHTAHLVMEKEAWEAMKNGEKVNISPLSHFKKKFLYGTHKK